MGSVHGQTVLITGASSGIGASCARAFASEGARLILAARRRDRLETLASDLQTMASLDIHILEMDVCDRAQVEAALSGLLPEWSTVDILINNAGLSRGLEKLYEGSIDDWEEMINTNLKGLLYVTRALLPGMVARGKGHVINLGSTAGHQTYPNGNVYCATKAAVRALSEGIKMDVLGTPVRVTSVDPGLVETEFSNVRFHGDGDRAKQVYAGMTPLTPDDVAEIILFCASRPPHVNISEVLVMPTDQSSSTMVHRQPS